MSSGSGMSKGFGICKGFGVKEMRGSRGLNARIQPLAGARAVSQE